MTNVLVFLDNFDTGGVTSVVRTIYRSINKVYFTMDFVRKDSERTEFDVEIINNGDTIYYYQDCGLNKIPLVNYIKRRRFIARQIIKQIRKSRQKYDAIHVHANPIIGLYVGKKLGIPVRIMHTHEAIPDFGDNIKKSFISSIIWKYRQKCYNSWSTIKAGDSKKACVAKFGKEVLNDRKMRVLYPPVDMQKFNPDNYDVCDLEVLGINKNCFNMIHVGRLNAVKNQKFLIEILDSINSKVNAHLYIVGDGMLKNELLSFAREKKVLEYVSFLPGNTTPAIYKLMQCSLLPSFSEAFGMVAVESQLMGVPCFASSNVPDDVDIGMCTFLNLDAGTEKWGNIILHYDYKSAMIDPKKKRAFETKRLIATLGDLYCGR